MKLADLAIPEQKALDFVAAITRHLPIGVGLSWPIVVGSLDKPGVPEYVLDGDAAMWSLSFGGHSIDRFDGQEIKRYQYGSVIC